MIIIGAGMAGLLAGHMLKHHGPRIVEMQPKLPNNHSAVLRFRTPQIGDLTGIPFKKVTMIKGTAPFINPIADALAYSYKTNGNYRSDRSVISGLVQAERFIAPNDFIPKLAERSAPIEYGKLIWLDDVKGGEPVISTIAMPQLMQLLEYDDPLAPKEPQFVHRPGITIRAYVANCDAYVSLLVPDPSDNVSRISITGSELIIELNNDWSLEDTKANALAIAKERAKRLLGIEGVVYDARAFPQIYAKIAPADDDYRKRFMHWATDRFNIYSLGRFATWRPGLLLDDLVNDIRLIDRWVSKGSKYDVARARQ